MTPTRRQKQCLDYLAQYTAEHGYAPNYREIATHLGLKSISGVHRLIKGLKGRGLVHQLGDRARAIRCVTFDDDERWKNLLCCAGRLRNLPTTENWNDFIRAVDLFDDVEAHRVRVVPTIRETMETRTLP